MNNNQPLILRTLKSSCRIMYTYTNDLTYLTESLTTKMNILNSQAPVDLRMRT